MHLPIPEIGRPFAAYIFDCDGTIADTMPLHYRAWARTMEALGGNFPEELHYAWGGMPNVAIVERLNEKFGTSVNPEEAIVLKHRFYLELVHEVRPIEPVVEMAEILWHGSPGYCLGGPPGNCSQHTGSLGFD
jgi:beta-phosphoglucomutase-like phosphatase (HAD superfamily)